MKTLENPFYYLENFRRVLAWIAERYADLLTADEENFIARFHDLPQASQALLVRMVMRKGSLFRASKLRYKEIGCTREAARPLAQSGWIDARPQLTLEQLFALLTKPEVAAAFGHALPGTAARKTEQLEALRAQFGEARPFSAWCSSADDGVYQLLVGSLCDRLRLMFFGNLRQDWSEFVLADLGIYRYETVDISASSRGFRTRADVDTFLHLHHCRERFELGEPPQQVRQDLPAGALENDWLEGRRQKLLFQLGQQAERDGTLPDALDIYAACAYRGARLRRIRVLERRGQFDAAHALAAAAEQAPESETESQQLQRILPRLRRKLGLQKAPARPALSITRIDLALPAPDAPCTVEELAGAHLAQAGASVHYVENTLLNSLFGLLCWEAVFAAVPGAFFHPFHAGPADLHSADFHRRREREFAACLAQIDSGEYIDTINRHFAQKSGLLSPFVFWDILTGELKDLALQCIPAAHLKKFFERMLEDIKTNRAGLPDLIQFWPAEKRYRMIEVKGPGDRLQDNQIRWLEYCGAHGIPVAVCHVQWTEGDT